MGAPANSPAAPGCPVPTSTGELCERLIHHAPAGVDPEPCCLMHSNDPNKLWHEFWSEIQAILAGTSRWCPKDRHDFTGFVFIQNAYFIVARFTQNAFFAAATFTQHATFKRATFAHDADFTGATFAQDADFIGATFTQHADFSFATFTQNAIFMAATFTRNADFSWATFAHDADFHSTNVAGVLDFRAAGIGSNAQVLLHGVNKANEIELPDLKVPPTPSGELPKKKIPLEGLRLRLRNTLLERMRFEDVRWYGQRGRGLILEDERELTAGQPWLAYEVVADAYRRLVNNFERARQYEWAEEATIGEMEMRRKNPERFLWFLRRWQQRSKERPEVFYSKHRRARCLGEHLSVAGLYRALSIYGTSYRRALWMLVLILFIWGLLFPACGLRPAPGSDIKPQCPLETPGTPAAAVISWRCALAHPHLARELWGTLESGLWASVETATFQRQRRLEPASGGGRFLAILETIAVPGQLALFLLALRRRFRR